jgi:hypothetical protein
VKLSDLISESLDKYPDLDAAEVAAKMMDEIERPQMIAALAGEVANVRRNRTRGVERTAFSQFVGIDHRIETSPEMIANLRRVFAERFSLGSHEWVEWGKATIEQHKLRIAMLERIRGGIDETIERHREAIRLIEAHNATCLDELERAA